MKRAANNLLLTLANELILYFFSERLFWTVWRTGDSVGDQVVTSCSLLLGTFFVQHVIRLGLRPIIMLPAVLALAVIPLWRHRSRQSEAWVGWSDPPAPGGRIAGRGMP